MGFVIAAVKIRCSDFSLFQMLHGRRILEHPPLYGATWTADFATTSPPCYMDGGFCNIPPCYMDGGFCTIVPPLGATWMAVFATSSSTSASPNV